MPKFRITRRTFIAPRIYEVGDVINYKGPLGPQFEPLDEEGEKALEEYYKENPNAAKHFVTRLRVKGGQPGEVAEAELVKKAPPPTTDTAGTLANPGKKEAGLADGGKVAPEVVAPKEEPKGDEPPKK